jgi:hypothetical protein
MNPTTQLMLGSALIGAAVGYYWWLQFRVWIFQQDLFEIRDRLWDQMRVKGLLDHQDHRLMRDLLNTGIHSASELSFWVMLIYWASPSWRSKPFQFISLHAPQEVKDAVLALGICGTKYLLLSTLTGWVTILVTAPIIIVLLIVRGFWGVVDRFAHLVAKILMSGVVPVSSNG